MQILAFACLKVTKNVDRYYSNRDKNRLSIRGFSVVIQIYITTLSFILDMWLLFYADHQHYCLQLIAHVIKLS